MVKKIGSALAYLFVLAVFCFSLYKIITISGIFEKAVFGFEGRGFCQGDLCDWVEEFSVCDWCGDGPCDWCLPPTQPSPEPSPELSPEPSPEPPLDSSPTPTSVSDEPPVAGGLPVDDGRSSGNGGPASPPHCGAEMPQAPVLLSVVRVSARLTWTAVDKATHYSIVYGQEPGNYLYGVVDTGRVTEYLVGGLEAGKNYCFAVRAVNGCMPGELSNELCLDNGRGGQVLGATTLAATGHFNWHSIGLLGYTLGCLWLGLAIRLLRKPNCSLPA